MFILTAFIIIVWIIHDVIAFKALDLYTNYILWCFIASVGTCLFGTLVSILIRPVYLDRYLYPVCCAMWLSLSIGLSKFKYKIPATLLTIIVSLFLFIPSYQYTIYIDNIINERNTNTVNQLNSFIHNSNNGEIITDKNGISMYDYYFPGIIVNGYSSEDADSWNNFSINDSTEYWLIIHNNEIDNKAFEDFKSHGFMPKIIIPQGVIGNDEVWIYKLEKI